MTKRPNQYISARVDFMQSLTGLILGLFIIFHIHFESSILLGNDAFLNVVHFLEGGMFSADGHGFSFLTRIVSFIIMIVFIIHALCALRRFPSQLGQCRALRKQMSIVNNTETKIWFAQLITGFILFFLVSSHLITMMLSPTIGPFLSAKRVFFDNVWLLYILLIPAVLIHAMFGLYRVFMKWGFLIQHRMLLRKIFSILLVYLLTLSSASLIKYIYIGETHTEAELQQGYIHSDSSHTQPIKK